MSSFPVDGSQKAVTHPVSGAVVPDHTEGGGGDGSTLQVQGSEVRKTVESVVPHAGASSEPQDGTKVALLPPPPPPPAHQGSGRQDASASQGTENRLMLECLFVADP